MGNLPQVKKPVRTTVTIDLHDHLADHHFMGTPVLPAVEAMELLAAKALAVNAKATASQLTHVQFDKFLPLDIAQDQMDVYAEQLSVPDAGIQTTLLTKTRAPKAKITRTKEHARMTIAHREGGPLPMPVDVASAAEGICETVDEEKIYQELVPFGPAYRNIAAPLRISADGALAAIQCPDLPTCSSTTHLGSPFALDAAFHAACVWGQHFFKMVAFPVAVDQRRILRPTRPGHAYWARVIPKETGPDLLIFDMWLLDQTGRVCEIAQGVRMRDVSGGRLQPPAWIQRDDRSDPLALFNSHCTDLTVIELDAVAPFAPQGLSDQEKQRYDGMGQRRRRSYVGARMALKRLNRRLGGTPWQQAAQQIETTADDGIRPQCGAQNTPSKTYCSASHNHCFAFAAASNRPIGIDVETVAERAVKCSRLYMSDKERRLLEKSTLGMAETAVRIWSCKEAVAKAHNINLAEAWHRAEITQVDETTSRLQFDGGDPQEALHAAVEDNIFTVFTTD